MQISDVCYALYISCAEEFVALIARAHQHNAAWLIYTLLQLMKAGTFL